MTKLKELEKRLKHEPDNLGLRVLVASALHDAGRRDDSIELYRSVAIAYRDQGRPQQAITVCRSVLAIAPGDERCKQLLAALLASPPIARASPQPIDPPPLPLPPRPGRDTDGPDGVVGPAAVHGAQGSGAVEPGGEDGAELERSFSDVTPLPAPLPYHIAHPTQSMPAIQPSDLSPSLQDELARNPQIAGIANAARQISASLIAASLAQDLDDDASGELETRRMSRISDDELRNIAGSPRALRGVPTLIDDDEPTLMPPSDPIPVGAGFIEDELTEPRELPLRTRPPSIAPPTTATGPLSGAFFVPVPPRHRAAVLHRCRRRMAAAGIAVIRRGEIGHGLIILVHGLLELRAERAGGERVVLGAIAPGEYVGEVSLLSRAPAAAEVVAALDSEILVLGESDFHDVVGAYPALRNELKHVAERRTREHGLRLQG